MRGGGKALFVQTRAAGMDLRKAARAKERGIGVDGVADTGDKDGRRFLHLFCSKRQIPESRPRRSVNAG